MEKPCVILVRPQMALNVGAVARVMSNTGFDDLRLVLPRENHLSREVLDVSAHAEDVLQNARICASVEEAIDDLDFVVMTTARARDMEKREIRPEAVASEISAFAKPGIVFGPERTGLTNEEVVFANALVSLPSAANSSYNLSHAAAIMLYLLSAEDNGRCREDKEKSPFATGKEIGALLHNMEEMLDGIGYFYEKSKRKRQLVNIKNIFTRSPLTHQDVLTLNGLIRKIKSVKNQ